MNVRAYTRTLAGLLVLAAGLMTAPAAHAAANQNQSASTIHAVSLERVLPDQPQVIVKLGDAMLEEYQHGNPLERTQILRGSKDAQNLPTATAHEKRRA